MAIIFWSEFPEEVDWEKVNSEIDFDTEIYIACKNKKEYLGWKKKVKNKHIDVGAWPVLDKKEGYWFSGQTSKECIDRLDEFKGMDIKIDIEPKIFNGKYSSLKAAFYVAKWIARPGENTSYLADKINAMDHENVIVSGAFFPRWIRKRVGQEAKGKKNYICYTSMTPGLGWLVRAYYRNMIKRESKDNFYAVGLCNHGIFGNEGQYNSRGEFVKDLELMKELGVKNLVVYSLEGVVKRDWINTLREYHKNFR